MPDETKPDTGALVRIIEPDDRLRRVFGADAEVIMSFDPKTPDGADLLFKCLLDKLPQLSDKSGEHIDIEHIFAHPAEKHNEEGEVSQFVRSVVITQDKQAYDCGSEGVRKAIVLIRSVRGDPPWKPPIRCKVVVQKTRQGRNWMILRPDASQIFANVTTPAKSTPEF